VVCGRDLKTWFAELAVDMDKIFEVIQYIMNLYRLLNGFDEREQMPSLLAKIDKPQTHP
jgi:cyclin C